MLKYTLYPLCIGFTNKVPFLSNSFRKQVLSLSLCTCKTQVFHQTQFVCLINGYHCFCYNTNILDIVAKSPFNMIFLAQHQIFA